MGIEEQTEGISTASQLALFSEPVAPSRALARKRRLDEILCTSECAIKSRLDSTRPSQSLSLSLSPGFVVGRPTALLWPETWLRAAAKEGFDRKSNS